MNKCKKDNELFWYLNKKKEKRWAYRHRYYDAMGQRREKSKQGFTSENEAYRELLSVRTNTLNGDTKLVQNSNLTVGEWLDVWFDTHKDQWKVSTRTQRETAIRLQMKPLIGKYKLAELDKTTYKRMFINKLCQSYARGTVALLHRLFKVAVNAAVDSEIIQRNRFTKITIPDARDSSEEKVDDNFYTPEELSTFLTEAKKENITRYTLFLLLAYTGCRRGEAYGLSWSNIDFDRGTISIERTRDNKGVRAPKTKRSIRTIIVDSVLLEQLKVYKKWCKETKLSFGSILKDDDFVFISYQSGDRLTDSAIVYGMRKVIERAGLKMITPHGLRHTHATILIMQRIPVKTIADRLGNTPQMIYDIYGHSFEALEKESVDAFGAAMQNVRSGG